jgi:hypothetical protein
MAGVRAAAAEGMAAAKRWRERPFEERMKIPEPLRPGPCTRCEGVGMVWWCGKPGVGGRKGPCPRCNTEGAKRFATEISRELIGDPRQRKFERTFTRENENG